MHLDLYFRTMRLVVQCYVPRTMTCLVHETIPECQRRTGRCTLIQKHVCTLGQNTLAQVQPKKGKRKAELINVFPSRPGEETETLDNLKKKTSVSETVH